MLGISMMPFCTRTRFGVSTLALVVLGGSLALSATQGCSSGESLNPQPLPPQGDESLPRSPAGTGAASDGKSSGAPPGSTLNDAGTSTDSGRDASPTDDAGQTGDAS